jgi:hypothetical protein
MKPKRGGIAQEAHQDYSSADIARAQRDHPGRVPGSVIVAMQPDTRFQVYTGCLDFKDPAKATTLHIPKGFCVLFRGDLIHNGVAYRALNYRIHCCLNYEGISWTAYVVESALPEYGICKFYDVIMIKGPRLTLSW